MDPSYWQLLSAPPLILQTVVVVESQAILYSVVYGPIMLATAERPSSSIRQTWRWTDKLYSISVEYGFTVGHY
jgi:hypothetical protein